MNEIMKKVNELFDMLVAKNKEADALAIKQEAKNKEQGTILTAQSEKDIALTERETKVEKVENILEIKQKNQETLIKITQDREKLADATSIHNQQVAKDKHEIEIREKGVNDDFATLKKGQAKLAEDIKKLEEDKKTYKEGIVKKIGEGIKI